MSDSFSERSSHGSTGFGGRPLIESLDIGRRVFTSLTGDEENGDGESDAARRDAPRIKGYEIVEALGSGGAATVYLGVQSRTAQHVAIKIFREPIARDDQGDNGQAKLSRVEREIDLLRTISLPTVPKLLDWGFTLEDRIYIVTEYVKGRTLGAHLDEHSPSREERVRILRDIARATHELNQRGVIHRDIKPSNVLISDDGEIRVLDLGIATLTPLSDGTSSTLAATLTVEGVPLGSPAFMSPEQARGERANVSVRTDVYGLGATLFYLLTDGGTPHPMDGGVTDQIRLAAEQPARDVRTLAPDIDRSLAAIVRKATNFAPGDRYDSAHDLAADLDRWLNGEPIRWQAPSAWTWTKYWARTRRSAAVAALFAIIFFVGMTVATSVAIAQAQIADDERRLLAEQQQLFEEREAFAQTVHQVLTEGVAAIRQNLDEGSYAEAVKLALGWQKLVEAGIKVNMDESDEYNEMTRSMMVDLIDIVADYDLAGRDEFINHIKANL